MSSCPPNGRNDSMDGDAGAWSQGREYRRFYIRGSRIAFLAPWRPLGIRALAKTVCDVAGGDGSVLTTGRRGPSHHCGVSPGSHPSRLQYVAPR